MPIAIKIALAAMLAIGGILFLVAPRADEPLAAHQVTAALRGDPPRD